MPDKELDGEAVKIEISPEAQAQLDADPELAEAFKEVAARIRQAQQDFHDGKYASFDEAMAAIGAVPFDPDED